MEYFENLRHRILMNIYKQHGLAYLKLCLNVCRFNAPLFMMTAVAMALGGPNIRTTMDLWIVRSMIVLSFAVSLFFLVFEQV